VPKPVARGCGGFKRRELVGGCANGIPLKLSTPAKDVPITVPLAMMTDGAGAASAEAQRRIVGKSILSARFTCDFDGEEIQKEDVGLIEVNTST